MSAFFLTDSDSDSEYGLLGPVNSINRECYSLEHDFYHAIIKDWYLSKSNKNMFISETFFLSYQMEDSEKRLISYPTVPSSKRMILQEIEYGFVEKCQEFKFNRFGIQRKYRLNIFIQNFNNDFYQWLVDKRIQFINELLSEHLPEDLTRLIAEY